MPQRFRFFPSQLLQAGSVWAAQPRQHVLHELVSAVPQQHSPAHRLHSAYVDRARIRSHTCVCALLKGFRGEDGYARVRLARLSRAFEMMVDMRARSLRGLVASEGLMASRDRGACGNRVLGGRMRVDTCGRVPLSFL